MNWTNEVHYLEKTQSSDLMQKCKYPQNKTAPLYDNIGVMKRQQLEDRQIFQWKSSLRTSCWIQFVYIL